jgi:predicted phosphodiesterase
VRILVISDTHITVVSDKLPEVVIERPKKATFAFTQVISSALMSLIVFRK